MTHLYQLPLIYIVAPMSIHLEYNHPSHSFPSEENEDMEVSETYGFVFTIQPSDIMSNKKPSTGMVEVVM